MSEDDVTPLSFIAVPVDAMRLTLGFFFRRRDAFSFAFRFFATLFFVRHAFVRFSALLFFAAMLFSPVRFALF